MLAVALALSRMIAAAWSEIASSICVAWRLGSELLLSTSVRYPSFCASCLASVASAAKNGLLSGGTSMTMSFCLPLLAAAADVLLALDVELFAAGALELDVDFEVLLEPQPMAPRLRTQTIMASRVRDRAVV